MGVVVAFPVEITSYKVTIGRDAASIELEGLEPGAEAPRRVAGISFGQREAGEFINRGGFLQIHRPIALFPGTMDLLRNEKPVSLHGNGTLSTSAEPAGEGEG